jgi:hypothetical protein
VADKNGTRDGQKVQDADDKYDTCGHNGCLCPLGVELFAAFLCLGNVIVQEVPPVEENDKWRYDGADFQCEWKHVGRTIIVHEQRCYRQ